MQSGISSILFQNEFRTGQNLDFLLSVLGEKITVNVNFYWEDIQIADENTIIAVHPDASLIGSIFNREECIFCDKPNAFSNYKIGDIIKLSYSGTNFTVTEIVSPNLVRCGGENFTPHLFSTDEYIYRANEMRSIRYFYNLVDGGFTFNSLVDGELQRLNCPVAATGSFTPMVFQGIKSYQIGSAQVKLIGLTEGRFEYSLTHETTVTPFFLASQYASLILGQKPSYFNLGSCLKYISRIGINRNPNDPTGEIFIDFNKPANTGHLGENFNGGNTNYSISGLTIKKVDLTVIPKLIFDEVLTVTFDVDNTTDTPFSNNNTKFLAQFVYLPESETMYQNNGRTMAQNFVLDRKLSTVGSAAANGENFGTGYQVIKNVEGVFVSSSKITITLTIDIGTDAEAILQQGDFSRYMLLLTTENHALADELSDKVALPVQIDEFAVVTTVSDLIKCTSNFIQHPYVDISDGVTDNVEVFPVDDVSAYCKFYIDLDSYPDDGIKIKKIRPKILLRKAGSADVILDDFSIDTSAYPYVGLAQDIAFTRDRVFKIPAGEVRKVITIARDYAADADNGYTNWYINWPFMVRWEYYLQLLGVASPIPADLIDITKPFNGINHFWHRFYTLTGWSIKFEIDFTFEQKGDTALQSFTKTLNSYDFEGGPNYASNSIKFYDNDTNAELTAGGTKFLQGWKPSRMEAIFNKTNGALPTLENVVIVLFMEPKEAGGIAVARRLSSKYVRDSGSWFLSTDGSEKVVVTNPAAGQYKGVGLINGAVLPVNLDYDFYARLYDTTVRPCMVIRLDVTVGIVPGEETPRFNIRLTSGSLSINWGNGKITVVSAAPGTQGINMPLGAGNVTPPAVYDITICGNIENISSFEALILPGASPITSFYTYANLTRLESDLADFLTFSFYSSKIGDGDLIFPVCSRNLNILRIRGADRSDLSGSYNTTLTTLDISNLSGDATSLVIQVLSALTTIILNPLMNVTSFFTVLDNEVLDAVFNFGTELFPRTIVYRCVTPITSGVTQANLDANIDNIYTNRGAYEAATPGAKTANFAGTNPAPGGTLVAPAGYIQADAVTVGNDGTPANAKEQIYVLVNQCIDNTVTKKYNWTITTN